MEVGILKYIYTLNSSFEIIMNFAYGGRFVIVWKCEQWFMKDLAKT